MPASPPPGEQAVGLETYLTTTPGIGGRLRTEAQDFQVIELGDGPPPHPEGRLTAARVRLVNWETNRFVQRAARDLRVRPGAVAFAGMKDKRAVTEQWFSFPCPEDRLDALAGLQDVTVLERRRTHERAYSGSHLGNRFVLRVRDTTDAAAIVDPCLDQIRAAGGVPAFFGPQRFGASFRPVTHRIGEALVGGDMDEAVRRFLGDPQPGEREEARAARGVFEETRDAARTLEVLPRGLDPEYQVLKRLKGGKDARQALRALPGNLLQLFVHAWQSYLFNRVLAARIAAGMGLHEAHIGDRVMGVEEDGTRTVAVTPANQARVQRELDRGRAVLTAPLPGPDAPLAGGAPGELERHVLDAQGVDLADFHCPQFPWAASGGRRRGILQPVHDLACTWTDGDPVVSFALGKGAYATVVMRELMKADVDAY